MKNIEPTISKRYSIVFDNTIHKPVTNISIKWFSYDNGYDDEDRKKLENMNNGDYIRFTEATEQTVICHK